ncbi:MAG: SDR family oxidoreductase [Gammaproteobacteria bacterium]|jgi:3-oxoacyl-[acyl-carrier protein] reductase
MDLENKVVVVTGAERGLGRKMAEMVAARGARLALAGIIEDGLAETAELCSKTGGGAGYYLTDVSDDSAIVALFNNVKKDFGRVDALISNAGITRDGLLVKAKDGKVVGKMSLEDWESVLKVDLRGVFLCAREAAVKMIEQGEGGVIINISSISRSGNVGQTNYVAAKAGVAAMTVTWANELARHGIRVAAIAPGFCDTKMVANVPQKILEKIVARIPLKRLGKPEEIGHSAVYILENDFYTGRVLEVDGGLRI